MCSIALAEYSCYELTTHATHMRPTCLMVVDAFVEAKSRPTQLIDTVGVLNVVADFVVDNSSGQDKSGMARSVDERYEV